MEKKHNEREWFWCSDCSEMKEQDRKNSCLNCYLRFPEKEAEKANKKK